MNQIKKDYFWNTLGSGILALSSIILLMAVTRLLGAEEAGLFAFAFAIAQQLQTVAQYEVRPYQSTDIKKTFSFPVYFTARVFTCLSALVMGMVYISFFYSASQTSKVILILLVLTKLFDAFEDVFHGMFQQNDRLDIAGKALFFRMLITLFSFIAGILLTGNLLYSLIITDLISIPALYLLNIPAGREFESQYFKVDIPSVIKLLIACFPLFLGTFVQQFIVNIPKYSIENLMTNDAQTIYNIIFMPAFVINLFSGCIFKPSLVKLAVSSENREWKLFTKIMVKGILNVIVITLFVSFGAYIIGVQALSFLYLVDLSHYRADLVLVMCAGGLNAVSVVLFYGLTVLRKQKQILLGYIGAAVFAALICNVMVKNEGIRGAVLLYGFTTLLLVFLFSLFLIREVNKEKCVNGRIL